MQFLFFHLHVPSRSDFLTYRPFAILFVIMLALLPGLDSSLSAQNTNATILLSIPESVVDAHPYRIVSAPDGELGYVTLAGDVAPFGEAVEDYANNLVQEINLHTLEKVRVFQVGFFPTEMVIVGQQLFVTCSNDSSLYSINLDNSNVTSFPMTDSSGADVSFLSGLVESPSGEIYVGSNGGNFDGSDENVIVFDPVSQAIVGRLNVPGAITRFSWHNNQLVIPVGYPDNDFSAAPVLRWIDPVTSVVTAELPITVDTSDFPMPSDITPLGDGTAALTVIGGSNEVFHIDLETQTLLGNWALPGTDYLQSRVLPLNDSSLVVADFIDGVLHQIDLATGDIDTFASGLQLPVDMHLRNGRLFVAEQGLEQVSVFVVPGGFIRGDVNNDQMIDISDPIMSLGYLFLGGDLACQDAADFNDDESLDLSDAISLLEFLFSTGNSPAYPYPLGGDDLGGDDLDCEQGLDF